MKARDRRRTRSPQYSVRGLVAHVSMCVLLLAGAVAPTLAQTVTLFDNFNRPDAPALGNGWVEKTPAAFALGGNAAQKQSVSSGYVDNIVYRAAGEDTLDVESAAEFTLTSASPGYPQIFVRVQSGTVASSGRLDAYMVYVNNRNNQAILGRQTGTGFVTTLATINIAPALNTADTHRLRFSAVGTNPVQLDAYVERQNGASWDIIGQASFADSSGQRISTAGSVGFSGYVENSYRYDNFTRTELGGGGGNPAPTTSGVIPASATEGDPAFTLRVQGSAFVAGAVVRWNGADRTTTFISASELDADISAADVATAGSATVEVFNPAPGGGVSNAQSFIINSDGSNPVPVTTQLLPGSATEGDPGFTLTVQGSDFVPGAVVRWNGANRTTTFVSATELTAGISAADIASAGTATVTVFNPAPGGGVSNPQSFDIDSAGNPVPVTTQLLPGLAIEGDPAFTLTVQGSDFVPGAVVRWNGANRTTTFVSATELDAAISAADIASAGTATVVVFNPAPAGGTSNSQTFTIGPAGGGGTGGMEITDLNPLSTTASDPGFALTVNGSGFTASSVVRWNGSNRATSFVDSSELIATISAADVAAPTVATVTVFTPGPSGGNSRPEDFFVLQATTDFFYDNFNGPNDAVIGNDWTEKNPAAFSIQNGEVVSIDTHPMAYPENVVSRPLVEDLLNVESSIEFTNLPTTTYRFPQLHARVQRDSIAVPNTMESYIWFLESDTIAILAVQAPLAWTNECYLNSFPIAPGVIQEGERYRLRFRVTGVNPVLLEGYLESYANGAWQEILAVSAQHDATTQPTPGLYCDPGFMPPPITSAGAQAFSKWTLPTDPYDNYYWMSVEGPGGGTLPPPALTGLSPTGTTAGGSAFLLTVNGANFEPGSVVRWNGADRTTTFVSDSVLEVDITAADIAAAGTAAVTVFNPTEGDVSNALNFGITPPPTGGFVDDFERADGPVLGNGWIEKTAGAFALSAGQAEKLSVSTGYRDNAVYRPQAEDTLNVEASMEMRLTNGAPGYPQLFTRIQSATAGNANVLDAYMLYISSSTTQAVLGRQRGSGFVTTLQTLNLSQALNTVDTYRLRMSAVGTNPVQLEAYVERLSGANWTIIGQASFADSSGQRISTAGSVGFAGYIESSYLFDNFSRDDM